MSSELTMEVHNVYFAVRYATNKELCNLFSNLDSDIPVMSITKFDKLQDELLSSTQISFWFLAYPVTRYITSTR